MRKIFIIYIFIFLNPLYAENVGQQADGEHLEQQRASLQVLLQELSRAKEDLRYISRRLEEILNAYRDHTSFLEKASLELKELKQKGYLPFQGRRTAIVLLADKIAVKKRARKLLKKQQKNVKNELFKLELKLGSIILELAEKEDY